MPLTPAQVDRQPLGHAMRWLRQWWPRRLKQQLVCMVSAVLLLALAGFGGYTAREQSDIARESVDQQATSLARSVAVASANLILTDSLDALEELATRSAEIGELRRLQVCSLKGISLSHVQREPGQAVRLVFEPAGTACGAMPTDRQPHIVHLPNALQVWQPVRSELMVGWVYLERDLSALHSTRLRIWRNTAVVTVLAVTLCAALLLAVMDKPLQLLNRAQQFAKQLADASGRQMPLERGPLEIEELTMALNEASMLLCQQMIMLEDYVSDLKANEAQLAQQNEQLNAIFAMSPDGLATFNREDRVQFVNQAFLDMTGLDNAQVIGQTPGQLGALLQEVAKPECGFAGLDACFANAHVQAEDSEERAHGSDPLATPPAHMPVLLERAGERRRVLALSGQHSQSVSVKRVLYVTDVTRQHTLDEMKSEFLSMAAHELRTPMVSIFGFTELMIKREMPAEQRLDLLGRIYRHSQSMVAILNELLDLARIESRRGQDFAFELLDLAELVQPVLADYKPPEGRQAPQVAPPDGPMPVRVDRHKMQQAVLNILSNAYKYSPSGGDVEVRYVRQTAPQRGGEPGRSRVGVVIADHGIGLSPDQLARMGERFFRADKSGNIPGTGLGVSIVKELMELMGGRMQVDSEPGQGTTVTLWL